METKLMIRKNGTELVALFRSNVDALEMCVKLYDALLEGGGEFELALAPVDEGN